MLICYINLQTTCFLRGETVFLKVLDKSGASIKVGRSPGSCFKHDLGVGSALLGRWSEEELMPPSGHRETLFRARWGKLLYE